ncbi:MAG: hypothetical protein KJZ93_26330 [Caldilineaceae bacterium]|nr:hypothetical protein [Caldilineaceae bacterium]
MTPTTHGQRLRRRQIAWQMLDRLDRLATVPALWWLRNSRNACCLAAIVFWLLNHRMDALLLFIVALILQLMIFQTTLVGLLREDGER